MCHLIAHRFRLKQLLKDLFQMTAVLSDSRQQPTLQAFMKMLCLFLLNIL